ncbi:unnamed protein product [Polarella glacialis]|uniref:JmjC domain-containing protein n=1 Tax=Polarella glacialis TaxID=89957 RepID=A0A813K747_POLGL|nr:unnamed protein product [Polarella glacialis]
MVFPDASPRAMTDCPANGQIRNACRCRCRAGSLLQSRCVAAWPGVRPGSRGNGRRWLPQYPQEADPMLQPPGARPRSTYPRSAEGSSTGGSASSSAQLRAPLRSATDAAESAQGLLEEAGLKLLSAGRQQEGLSLLLRAQRLAAVHPLSKAVSEVAAGAVEAAFDSPNLVPQAARRSGSLLLTEPLPRNRGKRCAAERADGESPSAARGGGSEGKASSSGGSGRRYEPWLEGGEVPRVNCGDPAGFQNALSYIARHVPVVMENLGLMPAATSKWHTQYLRQHTTEWPGMHVLRSPGDENRYLYFVPEQSDRDMSAFKDAPRRASSDMRLSFASFLRSAEEDPQGRYYLQSPLVLRHHNERGELEETWNKGIDGTLRADCDSDVDRHRLTAIQAAGGFGHWARSQLFVGPSDSLSPVHYDQYDNIYLQVAGEKHFLLFDPGAAEGLYPFPVSHPYDEYAMVDLEHVDCQSYPRARELLTHRGAAVTLRPGESLFIPTHWWHHVQGTAARGAWNISVNFWFAIHEALVAPPHPLPVHLELELARHVELLLSDTCGSAAVGVLAELLRQDAENQEVDEVHQADAVSLPARNFLLYRLQRILGPENVGSFVREFFPPERFSRPTVAKALQGPSRPDKAGIGVR